MCAITDILGRLHMSPVDRAEFCLGFIWKFQPGFWDEKRSKIQGMSSATKFGKQNTKIISFGPILVSVTLKAVSLQLNGMIMMWKIQQAMQDDAIQMARVHPANRDEVFI